MFNLRDTGKKTGNETTRASLELLYSISRELTTALDLHTVLQRVLFLALRNVGASTGSIVVIDDNGKPVDSAIITGDVVHSHTTQRLKETIEHGLAGWVLQNRQPVLIADTSADDRWYQKLYDGEKNPKPRSVISAPLLVRDRIVGVITLVNTRPGGLTNEHLSLIQAIADQAGIAVLNARLYAESKSQARLMMALADSAASITGSLNLKDVFQRILEQISLALRVQAAAIGLLEPDKKQIIFLAKVGWASPDEGHAHIRLGQGIAGKVAVDGRGMMVQDVRMEPEFDYEVNARTGLTTKSMVCVPIRDLDQTIGVIEAINPVDDLFEDDALLVLTGIGSLAGTAIRHAQLFERLQAAHRSYHELFDDSIDPILLTDWKGVVIEANRCAVTIAEYPKDTLCGMNIFQLHAIDEEQLGPNFEHIPSNKTLSYESLLRTRSKYDVPVEVYVRQVWIEGQSQLQWIFRDITERKNLDTLREDLIAMIYHDLRAPLANIVSSLDVLDTVLTSSDDASTKSLLNIALRSTERIQRLTNSLLDIKRLEAGQPLGDRVIAAPEELLRDAVDTVGPVAKNKQQDLQFVPPVAFPPVLVDAEMIRRVLINLIENAVKYTPSGGQIRVGGEVHENWVSLWVQDNGPGIPASEQQRIFDKFTRLDTKSTAKGLGLGLAYCKLAVQGHGGKIGVDSEKGAGAKFWITLPIANEHMVALDGLGE
jgi:PAS domain S-box-containing protein